jgi:hypothetical protein
LTAALALAAIVAAAVLLVGLGLFAVAMPLTTAALASVAAWAGWRVLKRRRVRG